MAYSAEVVRLARERLAQAKADRESENRAHLEEGYDRVPRLRQIDRELRQTMVLAAQAVFSGGGSLEEAMQQARQENLTLQRERAALVAENFEEGFLDDSPVCDRCGGSGYVGSTMCECLTELCRQEQKKKLTILSGAESFNLFRLDYYPDRVDPESGVNIRALMEKNYRICRRYAMSFSEKSGNLLLSGGTGLGKTFLSACIARVVVDNGYSVVYESAPNLFSKLERAHFNGTEELRAEVEWYSQCDLLLIDDLGTEVINQFTHSAFYRLLNDRLMAGKPMIISTNFNSNDLGKRYSVQVMSRMRGSFQRIAFLGEDIRVKKNGWE